MNVNQKQVVNDDIYNFLDELDLKCVLMYIVIEPFN